MITSNRFEFLFFFPVLDFISNIDSFAEKYAICIYTHTYVENILLLSFVFFLCYNFQVIN